MPSNLLHTVVIVEMDRVEPRMVHLTPWPWSVDADGQGWVFTTNVEAIAAVQAFQAASMRSSIVSCMLIKLMYHKTAFAFFDDAVDPDSNVVYAAGFMGQFHGQSGDLWSAVATYHSQTPGLGTAYLERVIALWPSSGRYISPVALTSVQIADGWIPKLRAWLKQAEPGHNQLLGRSVLPQRDMRRVTCRSNRLAALRKVAS